MASANGVYTIRHDIFILTRARRLTDSQLDLPNEAVTAKVAKKNLSQEPISLESPVRVLVDEGRPAKKCKWELYTVKQQGVKDDGAMEGENGGSTNEDDLACATMDMSAIER